MPDIVAVSDSLGRLPSKQRGISQLVEITEQLDALVTRIQRHLELTQAVTVSEQLAKQEAKTRLLTQTVQITDQVIQTKLGTQVSKSVIQSVAITDQTNTLRTKTRLISETTTIAEQLRAYKNDIELVPPQEIPAPQNIIGTRERRVRALRRAPRPIVIDEVSNVAIAPLKLLAFSDSNNKAIVGIRPRPTPNVALSQLAIEKPATVSIAQSQIKIQSEPMILKARLRLPLSSLYLTTAKLKLRPQVQSIHAVKAVNFEKMHKLTRIIKVAMLAETL